MGVQPSSVNFKLEFLIQPCASTKTNTSTSNQNFSFSYACTLIISRVKTGMRQAQALSSTAFQYLSAISKKGAKSEQNNRKGRYNI